MAKKKKVNKNLLIVITAVVGVVLIGGFILLVGRHRIPGVRRFFAPDPKPYWASADAHLAAGRLKEARADFMRALTLDATNVEGLTRYGDLLNEMARHDPDDASRAIDAWRRALEIKSDHTPALSRILESYVAYADLFGGADVYDQMGIRARSLAAIQKDNQRAQAYVHVAVIGKWLNGGVVDQKDITDAIAAIDALTPGVLDDARIPYHAARARLRLAHASEAAGDNDGARRLRDEARQGMDKAMKAKPEDFSLAYRNFFVSMAALERRDGGYSQTDLDAAQILADSVLQLAKDPRQRAGFEYVEMRIRAASLLVQRGKRKEAGEAFDALSNEFPNDQRARAALADFLRRDPSTDSRKRAAEILSKPQADDPTLTGMRARLKKMWELQRLSELAWLRMDLFGSLPKESRPAARDEIRKLIDDTAAVAASPDRNPLILKLRGRAHLLENPPKVLLALESFRTAHQLNKERKTFDRETANLLAGLYTQLQQDGPLREILQEIIHRYPGDPGPRKALVHILHRVGSTAEATRQLAEVERLAPQDPDVPNLRVRLLLAQGENEKALKMIDQMPTATEQDVRFKAAALAGAGKGETAVVLLQELCKKEIADGAKKALPSHHQLFNLYISLDRKADAAALIKTLVDLRPDDVELKILLAEAEGRADPELYKQFQRERLEKVTDPVAMAINQARQLLAQNKKDEAKKLLLDAEKSTNGNAVIVEFIFNHALDTGDKATAEEYLRKLVALNADQAGGLNYKLKFQMATGELDQALASAAELSQKMPHLASSWVTLGQAQFVTASRQKQQGLREAANTMFEAASTSFAKALQMQSDNPDALFGIVRSYVEMENHSLARVYIDRGLKLRAPHNEPFKEFDRILREFLGEPEKVTAQREKDLKERPDDVSAHLALAANYIRVAASHEGKDKARRDEFLGKARGVLTTGRGKWPEDSAIFRQLANVLYMLGERDEGLKVLQEYAALEKNKDRSEPHTLLGIYLARLPGRLTDAEAQFRAAVAKAKNPAGPLQVLGDFYLNTGQQAKAVEVTKRRLELATSPEARFGLLELLVNIATLDEAEPLVKAELDKKRNDANLLSLWGFVRFMRGDQTAAENAFSVAIREDAKNAPARYYMGLLRREQGDLPSAIREFQTARDLAPASRDVLLALAEALAARNQLDDAVNEMNTALNLAPKDRRLRQRVIELYTQLERWTRVRQLIDEAKADPDLSRDPAWLRAEARMHMGRKEMTQAMNSAFAAYELPKPEDRGKDETSMRLVMEILLEMKSFNQIIEVTDPVIANPQAPKPYWLYMIRGQAQKGRKQSDDAVSAEFSNALSAVDRAQDDRAAELVAGVMARTIGLPATAALLESRLSPRWTIQLVRIYSTMDKWEQANKLLDDLLSPSNQQKLSASQRLLAVNMAVSTYTMGALRFPEMSDKAISACLLYIEECKRLRISAEERMVAYNNLATLLIEHPKSPKPAEALTYSTQAVDLMNKLGRSHPAIIDTHGWVLVLSGKVDEGLEQLVAASKMRGAPVDVYYHLGRTYLTKSDPDRALSALERAQSMMKAMKDKGEGFDRSMEERIDKAIKEAQVAKRPSTGNTP